MSAGAIALVLQLVLGNASDWRVVEAGLTLEACMTKLYGLPLPTSYGPAELRYTCMAEDHE